MPIRPKSITVICWFLLITTVLSVISIPFSFSNPEAIKLMEMSPLPLQLQYALTFIGLSVTLACAIAMLKRKNWGRILYISYSAMGLCVGLATSPMKLMMIPGAIFFAVITLFLLLPKASAYFSPTSEDTADA